MMVDNCYIMIVNNHWLKNVIDHPASARREAPEAESWLRGVQNATQQAGSRATKI